MRVLRDKVLIQIDKVVKISSVILVIEDTEVKPPPRGLVIAVGPLVDEVEMGDIVHFERFDWNVAPEDCIIIKEDEILAKELDI